MISRGLTLNRESQCTVCLKHKSAWDAAHSGSQRSQCKLMQISLGRWVETVFYFISFLLVSMAGKSGITLWTLHQSNHCFLLFCLFFFSKHHGTQVLCLQFDCEMSYGSTLSTPCIQTRKSLQCLLGKLEHHVNARHDPCPGTHLAKCYSPCKRCIQEDFCLTFLKMI